MKRIARIIGGVGLIVVGFVLSLPLVPGPGIALMVLGLVILSSHYRWARRIVEWVQAKLEGIDPRKKRTGQTGTSPVDLG
ncbi:MAG: PGPGW domain-containing protein [Acidobacteria bacterium]|nr:PGPGW domain-containing protein [Acidobacteriota bacterium]